MGAGDTKAVACMRLTSTLGKATGKDYGVSRTEDQHSGCMEVYGTSFNLQTLKHAAYAVSENTISVSILVILSMHFRIYIASSVVIKSTVF